MSAQQARIHHYVPQWYQKRFMKPGQFEYYCLDLHPDVVQNNGRPYQKRALRRCGAGPCFYKDDLYTLKLGNWSTDDIEKRFFGAIDRQGRSAVELFSDFAGMCEGVNQATKALPQYMDAQRFRTPRGLDLLKASINVRDHSLMLLAMQRLYRLHTTMWMEGVWEIVRARHSTTKFIVSDEPVTFFNRRAFPSEIPYPEDVALGQVGTRTLFPLSLDACLIITHLQLVRNPWLNPTTARVNARAYQSTVRHLLDTQFGRELEENEVLRINYILKKRATRYIAAAEEEWLYPERHVVTANWSKLDDDWFLFPHLYKVPFTREILMGWQDGSAWAMDEYGRNPGNPRYKDEELHRKERITHEESKLEWARKRAGKSVAHVDEFRADKVHDKIMLDDLAGKRNQPV
jgi:hypothetical protein